VIRGVLNVRNSAIRKHAEASSSASVKTSWQFTICSNQTTFKVVHNH
jgi:hypothetical protein